MKENVEDMLRLDSIPEAGTNKCYKIWELKSLRFLFLQTWRILMRLPKSIEISYLLNRTIFIIEFQ